MNGVTDDVVPFEVSVEVIGSDILVDFTASPPEQPGPINTPLPMTISSARYTMISLVGGGVDEFINEGHLRPISVRTRPGTLFHPRPPAPIFLYGSAPVAGRQPGRRPYRRRRRLRPADAALAGRRARRRPGRFRQRAGGPPGLPAGIRSDPGFDAIVVGAGVNGAT